VICSVQLSLLSPPRLRHIDFICDDCGELVRIEGENSEKIFACVFDHGCSYGFAHGESVFRCPVCTKALWMESQPGAAGGVHKEPGAEARSRVHYEQKGE